MRAPLESLVRPLQALRTGRAFGDNGISGNSVHYKRQPAPKLTVNDPAELDTAAGAGPDVALHPKFLYWRGPRYGALEAKVLPNWSENAPCCTKSLLPVATENTMRLKILSA
jgi:hypothetical protein